MEEHEKKEEKETKKEEIKSLVRKKS